MYNIISCSKAYKSRSALTYHKNNYHKPNLREVYLLQKSGFANSVPNIFVQRVTLKDTEIYIVNMESIKVVRCLFVLHAIKSKISNVNSITENIKHSTTSTVHQNILVQNVIYSFSKGMLITIM